MGTTLPRLAECQSQALPALQRLSADRRGMPEHKERWEPTEEEDALSNRLLTTGQASLALNVHANTLRRWSDMGIIETYRIGLRGDRRFRLGDLVKLLSEEVDGEPPRPGRLGRAKRPDPAT